MFLILLSSTTTIFYLFPSGLQIICQMSKINLHKALCMLHLTGMKTACIKYIYPSTVKRLQMKCIKLHFYFPVHNNVKLKALHLFLIYEYFCFVHKQKSFSLVLIVFPACQDINCKLRAIPFSTYLGFCLIHKPEYLRKDHAAWYVEEKHPKFLAC